MKTICATILATLIAFTLCADQASVFSEVTYPTQWSQPQAMPNGTVIPSIPTRFETRSVGVQLRPNVVVVSTSPTGTNAVVALILAADRGDLKTTKTLIAKGANVNAANIYGATALMAAAAGGYIEIASLLIENRADVNEASKLGKTPLIYASEKGHLKMVQLLLDKKADPKVIDESGKMAIDYATAGHYQEIAELLKGESGAKK